jgi:hypothetical protein
MAKSGKNPKVPFLLQNPKWNQNQITIAKNQKCIFTLVTYKDFSFYGKYA